MRNTQSLCGMHIFTRILIHWSQHYKGLVQKYAQNFGNQIITVIKLCLHTIHMRRTYPKQCDPYKSVYGLSVFPNCPVTTSTAHFIKPILTIIFLYMFLPLTKTPFITLFCHSLRTWNSLPFSVTSLHNLKLFKRLCLFIYNYSVHT